jgi:hypothetical protein
VPIIGPILGLAARRETQIAPNFGARSIAMGLVFQTQPTSTCPKNGDFWVQQSEFRALSAPPKCKLVVRQRFAI